VKQGRPLISPAGGQILSVEAIDSELATVTGDSPLMDERVAANLSIL
jgi:hypothetical protein